MDSNDVFIREGVQSSGNQLGLVLAVEAEEQTNHQVPVKDAPIVESRVEVERIEEDTTPQPSSSFLPDLDLTQIEAEYAAREIIEEVEEEEEVVVQSSATTTTYREVSIPTSSFPTPSADIPTSTASSSSATLLFPSTVLPNSHTSPTSVTLAQPTSSPTPIPSTRLTTSIDLFSPTSPTTKRNKEEKLLEDIDESPDPMRIMSHSQTSNSHLEDNVIKGKGKESVVVKVNRDKKTGANTDDGRSRSRSVEPLISSSKLKPIRQSSEPPVSISLQSSIDESKLALRERLQLAGKKILLKDVEVENDGSEISRIEETEFEDSLMEEVPVIAPKPKKLVKIKSPSLNSDDEKEILPFSSSLPPLTQTQFNHLPFPSSSLSPLTQTQYLAGLSPPFASVIPSSSQISTSTTIITKKRLPRAAVRASIIESSQVAGMRSDAMDSTQDFVIPKTNSKGKEKEKEKEKKERRGSHQLEKGRDYGFKLEVETDSIETYNAGNRTDFTQSSPQSSSTALRRTSSTTFSVDIPYTSPSNSKRMSNHNPISILGESPQKKIKTIKKIISSESDMETEEDEISIIGKKLVRGGGGGGGKNEGISSPLSSIPSLSSLSSSGTSEDIESSDDSPVKKLPVKKSKVVKGKKSQLLVKMKDTTSDVDSTDRSETENDSQEEEEETEKESSDEEEKKKVKKTKKKVAIVQKKKKVVEKKKIVEKKVKKLPVKKNKVNEKEKKESVVEIKKVVPKKALPALQPPRTSQLTTGSSMNLGTQSAPVETLEEQANDWSLGMMDKLVWIKVESKDGGFFWPGDIISTLKSERPLKVQLLCDEEEEILKFSTLDLSLESPSPLNILTFRSSNKNGRIRYDSNNFNLDISSTLVPTSIAFDNVLYQALKLEAARDAGSDESEVESEEEIEVGGEETDELAMRVSADIESDDELTRVDGEDAGLEFPFKAIGKAGYMWWPGWITEYEPPSKGKKNGKFLMEWCSGTESYLASKDYLTPIKSEFFTVKLGQVELEVKKNYASWLSSIILKNQSILQDIIDDNYLPSKSWNKAFFAGPSSRQGLAKRARYGELLEEHLDAMTTTLLEWTEGKHNNRGDKPMGSSNYDSLPPQQLQGYISDVLLPLSSYLIHIEEGNFLDTASLNLFAALKDDSTVPTQDEILMEAFRLADKAFELGSAVKWVESCRDTHFAANANHNERHEEKKSKQGRRR